jgi:hypothetical protein
MGFDVTDQLLIRFVRTGEKWEGNEIVYQLFMDFKIA